MYTAYKNKELSPFYLDQRSIQSLDDCYSGGSGGDGLEAVFSEDATFDTLFRSKRAKSVDVIPVFPTVVVQIILFRDFNWD